MRRFHIHFCDPGIMFHHLQAAVAQQRLKREYIAARTQIRDGERMPETVGMTFLHAGFGAQRIDQLAQGVAIKGPMKFSDERRRTWRKLPVAANRKMAKFKPCS